MKHTTIIEVRDVSFSYDSVRVLKSITFTVEEGAYVAILGPNGGGKTTLLKILLGLLEPRSGTVRVFGEDVRVFQHRERISYVPQRGLKVDAQFPATVAEVVESGVVAGHGVLHGIHASTRTAIRQAMQTTGIAQLSGRLVSNLSGGEQQRVYVARALAGQPKILILDEPTAGIDVDAQAHFYKFLKQLNTNLGLTILFASHDVDVITRQADTVLCINQRLVSHGSVDDVVHSGALQSMFKAPLNQL